ETRITPGDKARVSGAGRPAIGRAGFGARPARGRRGGSRDQRGLRLYGGPIERLRLRSGELPRRNADRGGHLWHVGHRTRGEGAALRPQGDQSPKLVFRSSSSPVGKRAQVALKV